jgi:adenylate cyclase
VRRSAYRTVRQGAGAPALAALSVVAPVPDIAYAAVALGHVNVAVEPDGAARFAHPVAQVGAAYHPALAVQAARVYLGHAPEEVRLELGHGLWIGPVDVPTDASMRTVVRYYGPDGTFPQHSFSDLIHGEIPADALRGRIVLVGVKAHGLSDRFRSAFTPRLSGTERTATVIANLLRGEGLVRRAGFWLWDLALALSGGLLLVLLARRLSAYALTALAIAVLGAVFAIDYLALVHAGAWLSVTLPGTVISAIGAALVLAHHLHQSRLARAIRGAFGRYLHPELVRSLIATGFASAPGSREASVLFADLAGFTSMAEEMSPEQVVGVLNEYFSAVTAPIEDHHGLVTQYQGDALLAVFNVPFEHPDHAAEAVRAAREILAVVRTRRFGGRQLAVRIGINTGPVVAGSVGSPSHLTYTVHGDAVNLAARLEVLNKEHGTALLIAGSTASRLGEGFDCTPVGTLPIRGKREAVSVYRVEP